jgi:hypothetical protein
MNPIVLPLGALGVLAVRSLSALLTKGSSMTELIWDGKYDHNGRKTAPVRLALPFQDIETVNESAQVRTLQLDLWSRGAEREWRNRLIWGDKKYVLPSLLPEFAGKINLIYIDPPFNTGSDFSFTAMIPQVDISGGVARP